MEQIGIIKSTSKTSRGNDEPKNIDQFQPQSDEKYIFLL